MKRRDSKGWPSVVVIVAVPDQLALSVLTLMLTSCLSPLPLIRAVTLRGPVSPA